MVTAQAIALGRRSSRSALSTVSISLTSRLEWPDRTGGFDLFCPLAPEAERPLVPFDRLWGLFTFSPAKRPLRRRHLRLSLRHLYLQSASRKP